MTGRVRTATPEDAGRIAVIYRPIVVGSAVSFEIDAPGEEEMRRRILNLPAAHPWLVWEDEGLVQGYAYSTELRSRAAYRFSAEMSVYVDEAFRGRGLGRSLCQAVVDELEKRGFANAFAAITLPNPSSVALFTSMNFEQVGVWRAAGFKLGMWHDVGWWQRRLSRTVEQ
jgi:L-amino acid N-acyltransferase YncA